jgi:hypothetical protein
VQYNFSKLIGVTQLSGFFVSWRLCGKKNQALKTQVYEFSQREIQACPLFA